MGKKLIAVVMFFAISFSFLYMRIYYITQDETIKKANVNYGNYVTNIVTSYGNIYDCNMQLLNNRTVKYLAVINPTAKNIADVMPYIKDKEYFNEQIKTSKPFVCEVTCSKIDNSNIIIFPVKNRYDENQIAVHTLGYTVDNKGVTGIEKSFSDFLHENYSKTKVTYRVDGMSRMIDGVEGEIERENFTKSGIITTIDYDIQKICEDASKKIEKGAIIVMDPFTSEIKAVVSVPAFSPVNIETSLESEDSPFVNRAFSAYAVGSIFKLVTASAAIESGVSIDTQYECTGKINVDGQEFKCHKHDGHGLIDMKTAMAYSCNTYFINLANNITASDFINTASALGFGKENIMADGLVSVSGNLQTEEDLINSAEKANMAFGQGKLTATPLQIANMTCAIVNNGVIKNPQLIKGTTDGENITLLENSTAFQAIESLTAYDLRQFMIAAVNENDLSAAIPENTTAAGKTSTAQTGRFNENGEEYVEAWITGYFPVNDPKYVITVLVEDGKTGNLSAGPVFKEIAENITEYEKSN